MSKLYTVIAYVCLLGGATTYAGNLIDNGDFSSGNTGFTSGYSYVSYNYLNYTLTPQVVEGDYTVGPNVPPSYGDWAPFHTVSGGSSQMLIANGAPNASQSVWAQSVSVSPNTTYEISFYLAEISGPGSPADIALSIGGSQIGAGVAPSTIDIWQQYSFSWNSASSSTALLALNDLNTNAGFNDFAIDNISMSTVPDSSSLLELGVLPLLFLLRRIQTKRQNFGVTH